MQCFLFLCSPILCCQSVFYPVMTQSLIESHCGAPQIIASDSRMSPSPLPCGHGAPQIVGDAKAKVVVHSFGFCIPLVLLLLLYIILLALLLLTNTLTNYYGGELYTCAPFPLPYCCAWRGGFGIIVLRRTMGTAPCLPLLYF